MDAILGCYVWPITFHRKNIRLTSLYMKNSEFDSNKLILWEPTDCIANIGIRQISYIDNLMNNTGIDDIKEFMTIMSHLYKPLKYSERRLK